MLIKKSIASGLMGSVRGLNVSGDGRYVLETTLKRIIVQQSMLQLLDLPPLSPPPLFRTWESGHYASSPLVLVSHSSWLAWPR